MKLLGNKTFWIGFFLGMLFTLMSLLTMGYLLSQPVTDCDSCINGTTP